MEFEKLQMCWEGGQRLGASMRYSGDGLEQISTLRDEVILAGVHPRTFKAMHPGTELRLKAKEANRLPKPEHPPHTRVEHLTKARLESILSSETQKVEDRVFSPKVAEEQTKPSELSNTVRTLMRSVPHSVVVVTAARLGPSSTDSDGRATRTNTPKDYRGMTVSSFTTITLSPYPIISFNAKIPSKTLDAINESRHFLIHILEASEDGRRIADVFTKGSKHVERILGDRERGFGVKKIEVKTGVGMKFGIPQLHERGVMRVLRCSVLDDEEGIVDGLLRVGDHVLVVAKVEEVLLGEGRRKKSGLCYADGEYRSVGNVIDGDTGGREVRKGEVLKGLEFTGASMAPGEGRRLHYAEGKGEEGTGAEVRKGDVYRR